MPGEYKYKKKIWGAAICASTLTFSYLAFFGMTIKNIAEYQNTEKEISSITAELSQMEFAYLSKEAEINPTLAQSMGFVEPTNIVIAHFASTETAFASDSKKK